MKRSALMARNAGVRIRDRLLMQPWFQGLLTPFGRIIHPPRWVFILGCYNSGTTLLANLLQQHPELNGMPNEGAFLSDSLPVPERLGWPRMWVECIEELQLDDRVSSESRALRIKKQWSHWIQNPELGVVEKSIGNTLRIQFLQQHFAPAYFVHIIRDGYATAAGIRKKANLARWKNRQFAESYPISLCAKQWRATEEVVAACMPSTKRLITIKYEDLTESPELVLDEVFGFLELETPGHFELNRKWVIHESYSEIKNMNQKNYALLSEEDCLLIEQESSKELTKYNYDRPALRSR